MHLCMNRRRIKMYCCTVSFPQYVSISQSLIVDQAREPSHNELPWLFCQKCYTHTGAAGRWNESTHQKEEERCTLSCSIHSLYSWGFLFFWLLRATSQKVIFHLASSPAAVSSMTDKPSGFARSLVPADGTAVLMGHSGVPETAQGREEGGGGSYGVWVIVTLSGLWNAREKCEEWMSQLHGNTNKGKAE